MKTQRKASFHGPKHLSRNGSTSKAKLRISMLMTSFVKVLMKNGVAIFQREACTIKKSKTEKSSRRTSDRARRNKIDLDASQITDVQNYRIFVATWNVAGKSPPSHLNLEEWLHTSPPADIYVLGFQEIVPLNAGNVLGTEDNGPAQKWLALIRKTLNSLPGNSASCRTPSPVPDSIVELDDDFEGSNREKASAFFQRRSLVVEP